MNQYAIVLTVISKFSFFVRFRLFRISSSTLKGMGSFSLDSASILCYEIIALHIKFLETYKGLIHVFAESGLLYNLRIIDKAPPTLIGCGLKRA